MRYFGSKQRVQPDENEIAIERLMAIASRYKADLPSSSAEFEVVSESDEPLDLFEEQPPSQASESPQ